MGVIRKLLAMTPTEYLDLVEPNTRLCGKCHTRKPLAAFPPDSKADQAAAGRELARFAAAFPEPLEVKQNRLRLFAQHAEAFGQEHPRWTRHQYQEAS